MAKVILEGFDIAKLFDVIFIEKICILLLFPKNKEIKNFLKNNSYIYFNKRDSKNYTNYILLETEEDYIIDEIMFIIEYDDVFEINFETEEEAFYFKLKYC